MDPKAMFKINYGLFVLAAREGEKDNACIINTLMQVTSTPNRVTITVNKTNFTHDMVARTGVFTPAFIPGKTSLFSGKVRRFVSVSVCHQLSPVLYDVTDCRTDLEAFLASQGCDMIQGYYFLKPMPHDEYEERIRKGRSDGKDEESLNNE